MKEVCQYHEWLIINHPKVNMDIKVWVLYDKFELYIRYLDRLFDNDVRVRAGKPCKNPDLTVAFF